MDPKILEKFNQKAMQDKKRGYGKEVDIWSLGCICYGLYRGKYPFQANNFAELIDKINYGKYSLPKTASKEIYSFLDKMLQYDGKARLSAEELINHPFLTTNPKNFTHIEIGENTKEIKEKKSNIPLYKYEGSNSQKNNTYPEHHIKVANKTKKQNFSKTVRDFNKRPNIKNNKDNNNNKEINNKIKNSFDEKKIKHKIGNQNIIKNAKLYNKINKEDSKNPEEQKLIRMKQLVQDGVVNEIKKLEKKIKIQKKDSKIERKKEVLENQNIMNLKLDLMINKFLFQMNF